RHQEQTLARELERDDLRNDAEALEKEDAAEDDREKLVLGEDGARAEAAAERERSHIPHEDLRGVRVVPKETDARADHGPAEHGELAGARDKRNVEVLRDDEALRDVDDAEGRTREIGPDQ